jgi:UDP-N-acetylmuramate--alanine ligase
MNLNQIKSTYFLGIGGIGMSAIARYLAARGVKVSGYDRSPTLLTEELAQEGIDIHFQEDPEAIPNDTQLVVFTPAIPADHAEWNKIRELGVPVLKRAELLGLITKAHPTLAIAGTHGKTSTSTLAAHILHNADTGCTAFLGGVSKNYHSNLLYSGDSSWMVAEADEYDRSFLHLSPRHAVITAIDADHLDIYGDYEHLVQAYREFAQKLHPRGLLLVKKGFEKLLDGCHPGRLRTYALYDSECDFFARNIRRKELGYTYDIVTPSGIIGPVWMQVPALMNIENSIAAAALALETGCSPDTIAKNISTFKGIRRRFDILYTNPGFAFIDDYAHHPEEIKALAHSLRDLFPDREITAIFQPHLYTRTRDFARGFAESLSLFDEVYLLNIYPAREMPLKNISSKTIADKMKIHAPILSNQEAYNMITGKKTGVVVTIGAGDIEKLALLASLHFNQENP